MKNWKKVSIKSICINVYDAPHATPKPSDGGAIFLGIKNITEDGTLDLSNIRYIAEDDFLEWTKRVLPKAGDIIFSYEATLNRYAIIPKGFRGCLGRRLGLIRTNDKKVDNRFLFYYFFSKDWRTTISQNILFGSTVNRIPVAKLPDFQIYLPSLETQKKIADVLSALDAKIELNNRINAELEAMAKTLYDYWFVQFDFPDENGKPYKSSGGKMVYNETLKQEIPKGWEVKKLINLCNKIGDGIHGTPKYVSSSNYSFINGNNLKSGFITIDNETKRISENQYKRYYVELSNNTILLSINGTIGNLALYYGENVMLGKSAAYINCKDNNLPYCYQFLSMNNIQQTLWNIATGSTIKNLSLDSLKRILIPCPGIHLINNFYRITKPIDAQKINLFRENQQLIQLRDWLLPMLMNGQVTVK